ncbi:MAG: hypothetical protein ACOYOE_11950 [Chlorobium sp.]
MNSIKRWLALIFLPKALKRSCPKRIPRSGPEGMKVNCYATYIDKAGEPYFLIESIQGEKLLCLEWNNTEFDKYKEIDISDIDEKQLSITHYYGSNEISYKGIIDFAFSRILLLPYIKVHTVRLIESVDQYFFNKKKLVTKPSIDLLKILMEREQKGKEFYGTIDLMTILYSIKWLQHPDRELHKKKLNFYIESLVDSGELKRKADKFMLSGKGRQAIENYEEQERKHSDNIKAQRRIFWLSVVIALLTAVQAGLIKLPTLVDFSSLLRSLIAFLTTQR